MNKTCAWSILLNLIIAQPLLETVLSSAVLFKIQAIHLWKIRGYLLFWLLDTIIPYSNFVRKITRMDNSSHIMCIYVCQHHILGGPLCSRALSLRIIAVPGLYCCTNCWFLNGCQIFAVPYVRSNVYLSHQNISARRERTVNVLCLHTASSGEIPAFQSFSAGSSWIWMPI